MTGSSELTHANGLATGPVQAQESLESFPRELKVVSLYLALNSERASFNKLVTDVYMFMKDRYFIGEVLEAFLEGKSWYNCTILQVRGPTDQEIKDYQDSPRFSDSTDEDQIFPPACLYRYQVEKFCSYNDINRVFEASASHVKRKKRVITKGKLTLFLKQCLTQNPGGTWSIQNSIEQNLGINGMKFSDIFVGQPPQFPKRYIRVLKKVRKEFVVNEAEQKLKNGIIVKKETIKKSKHVNKTSVNCFTSARENCDENNIKSNAWHAPALNSTVNVNRVSTGKTFKTSFKYSTKIVKKVKKKYGKSDEKKLSDNIVKRKYRGLTWEERQKLKEKKSKCEMMEKLKRSEEKLKAKAKREEEKLQMAQIQKDHNRLREDLECEDLKPMPVPREVKCSYLPNELFGDFMVILEFFHSFPSLMEMKVYFPRGISFDELESALVGTNIEGPLCNIIISLLSSLFKMQEDDNEVLDIDTPMDLEREEVADDTESTEAARLAAAERSRLYQGALSSENTLNHLTVTEILRLHLLSCWGGKAEPNQRDVSSGFCDPVSVLRSKHPHIIRDLSTMHVCEISIGDKIRIINCLIDQVLACVPVREELDERGEQLRQVKLEIRAYKAAEVKRNKEANAQRRKEKREAKMKLKEGDTSQSSIVLETDVSMKSEADRTFEKDLRSSEKKYDFHEKVNRLRNLSMNYNLHPIGKDRAHRRYWIFSTLPGLYVENNPFEIGPCPPQATLKPSGSPNRARVKSPNRKNTPSKSPSKSVNGAHSRVDAQMSHGGGPTRTEMWACTSSFDCPVHGQTVPRCRWSYFAREDDVSLLSESLNRRGYRESELRKIIVRDEQWLKETVGQCPVQIVNPVAPEQKGVMLASSKYRHLNCPPETSVSYLLELILREQILELESRISSRCMGSLDVKDIAVWRQAIEMGGYDMQCNKLRWGFSSDQSEDQKLVDSDDSSTKSAHDQVDAVGDGVIAQNNIQNSESSGSPLRRKSLMKSRESPPGRVLEEKNGENRRASFSESNFNFHEEMEKQNLEIVAKSVDSQSKSSTIKDLASAILQLSQAVDVTYLRNPLADEEDEDEKMWQLKHWEVSLMNSLSFSQLFFHIFVLDASIYWSKSVLNTRCVLCRRRGDGEKMLLCDGCNRGHHLYCLKPKLAQVPDGDWFCFKCQPEQNKNSSERKRKLTNSGVGGKQYERRPSKSRKIVHHDVCNACGLRYNLILCSFCPFAYHTVCVNPPLKEAPEESWMCPDCNSRGVSTEEKENESLSRRSSRRKSGASDVLLNSSLLQDLLSDLMCHRDSWPFLQPVRKAEAPRYHIIIKKPMDLGTMKYKLNRAQYQNNSEFIADALLVFENCRMYNDDDTDVYKSGSRLLQFFKKRCKDLGLDVRD